MLPANSTRDQSPRAVCYVLRECSLKTWAGAAIEESIRRRDVVHVLHCGVGVNHIARARNHSLCARAERDVRSIEPQPAPDHSEIIHRTLERLARDHQIVEVHFGLHHGSAFRVLQAKVSGLAFGETEIVVHLDSTSQQLREQRQSWTADLNDVMIDYMEKYSFENADRIEEKPQKAATIQSCQLWKRCPRSHTFERRQPLVTIGVAYYNLGVFLPELLHSIRLQTYRSLDVIIVDDGSTDAMSAFAFDEMKKQYPEFRFLRQSNSGIGATRNRCLAEAKGEYFIPMDADNIAAPNMVERFVEALERNRHFSAMTCYYLAFTETANIENKKYIYAGRPLGGPHAISCLRNVYGDANGIFRTEAFRAIGGYEVDRSTSNEDWEAYVKLIQAGHRIGVVPDYLFYYRHRESGFSRSTNWFANHQRVMRQFTNLEKLPPGEAAVVWTALLGFHQHSVKLAQLHNRKRYRLADASHRLVSRPYRWLRSRLAAILT